jgi:hypothetical protein
VSARRWERLAPASGIVFVVLIIAAQPFIGGDHMDTALSASAVAGSLLERAAAIRFGAVLIVLSVLALLWFGATLRTWFARVDGSERLATVVFSGAIMMAVFLTLTAALMIGAVDLADYVKSEDGARAAVALSQSMFVGILAGMVALMAPSAVLTFRTGLLPRSLGALAAVAAGVSLVPLWPIGPLGALLTLVWIIATSISLLRRFGAHESATP